MKSKKVKIKDMFEVGRSLTEEEASDVLIELQKKKWYSNAVAGFNYLKKRHNERLFDPVPTHIMMEVTRAETPSQWGAILQLLKTILFMWELDLTNVYRKGYAITTVPEFTIREIAKSLLRSFGHIGSAKKRRFIFDDKLQKELTAPQARVALGMLDSVLEVLGGALKGSRKVLLNILEMLELDEIESQMWSTRAVLDLEEDVNDTMCKVLEDIKDKIN